ncbi:MAG: hypothetical protein KAR47_01155, partial [Planctomycetes bacterium]|nr:hypothetical protein [Planctomycetota bacterium]
IQAGTDLNDVDSDGDGLLDGWEVSNDLDPLDDGTTDVDNGAAGDPDNDGVSNLLEQKFGLDPQVSDEGASWDEYAYDLSGKDPNEIRYGVVSGSIIKMSEVHSYLDKAGRRYMTRRLADPLSGPDDTNDDITITLYDIEGAVTKVRRKGPGENDLDSDETDDIITTYLYDVHGRMTKQTDTLAKDTTYLYDKGGNATRVTLPGSRVTDTEYDAIGRATKVTDPSDNYTVTDLDSRGRAITRIAHNFGGTKLSQQRWYYDGLGGVTRQVAMADATSTAAPSTTVDRVADYYTPYDSVTKRFAYTYSAGLTITSQTLTGTDDPSGRGLPTETTSGLATGQPKTVQRRMYTPGGRVTQAIVDNYDETGSVGQRITTRTLYDGIGRATASIAKGDSELTTSYKYDGADRQSEITSPKGNKTTFAYDAMGRMTLKTEDDSGIDRETEYVYDRLGRLVTLIANDGTSDQTTSYDYDEVGRVLEITYPDTGEIKYAYSDAGQVTRRIDQRGISTAYKYDVLGRLTAKHNAVSSPSIVEAYSYDDRGLMVSAVKGNSITTANTYSSSLMDYDGLGRITRVRQVVLDSGNVYTTNYERDQLGRATQIEYPDRSGSGVATIDYSYTSLGSIDEIDRGATTLAAYDYHGSSVRKRDFSAPSVEFTPTYDSFGRATSYVIEQDSVEKVNFAYSYDNNGNIVSKIFNHRDTDPANIYSYDDLDRVTGAGYLGGAGEEFVYDVLGNRDSAVDNRGTTTSYSYDSSNVNEYTEVVIDDGGNVTTKTPLYDAAGNLTKDIKDYTYHYDYENRITKVEKPDGPDEGTDLDPVAAYTYDALGRRIVVEDSVGSATTHYYYDDGQRVLLETDGSDTDQRYFVFGNYIDEVLVMTDNLGGTIEDHYYGHDHLSSPVILFVYDDVIPAWVVGERYEYDAYGKCAVLDANLTADTDGLSDHANPYLFTGRRLDVLDVGSLENYYYRARYYDPDTGRFLSKDPIGYDKRNVLLVKYNTQSLRKMFLSALYNSLGIDALSVESQFTCPIEEAVVRFLWTPSPGKDISQLADEIGTIVRRAMIHHLPSRDELAKAEAAAWMAVHDMFIALYKGLDLAAGTEMDMNLYQYVVSNPLAWVDPYGYFTNESNFTDCIDACCQVFHGHNYQKKACMICCKGLKDNPTAEEKQIFINMCIKLSKGKKKPWTSGIWLVVMSVVLLWYMFKQRGTES